MKTKGIEQDKVYAKLIALGTIYEKEENNRQVFLKRISYSRNEMKAVINEVSDPGFRSWIESVIPIMQCREIA